ncbi:hypothetical protein MMC16_001835 [Acarospora aff. strigata]|nr:hypothetical protein [Acarospora aff. strigata]
MHPTTLLAFLLPTLTLTSAWRLQLYRHELYRDNIVDRRGTFSQPCASNFPSNAASSMHWNADGLIRDCEIVLYNSNDCTEAAGVLGRSRGDWNVPRFSSQANDKVGSYKINC